MKKVYESLAFHRVGHMKSLLESEDIPCVIRNLGGSSVMGEVPFTEVFPELWITNDQDLERARQLVREHRDEVAEAVDAPDWTCPACAESVPGNFQVCWNCGAARDAEPT